MHTSLDFPNFHRGRGWTAIVLAGLLATSAGAATIHVDDDAPDDPGPGNPLISDPLENGSVEHPYDAIQEAVLVAVDGDKIVLADGTYKGIGNREIDFGGKAVELRSANGPAACVINCSAAGQGFIFQSGETSATILDGVTIRDGRSDYGAGLYLDWGSPTIRNCVIDDNWAGEEGGGAYVNMDCNPSFVGCIFSNNYAYVFGGGACVWYADPKFTDCVFKSNTTCYGGGLTFWGSRSVVTNCVFSLNVADYGGGIANSESDTTLIGCQFISNEADGFS